MSDFASKHCTACEGGVDPMTQAQVQTAIQSIPGWETSESGGEISKTFHFSNYYETMAFVNAIAWMAHQENHHPDLEVHYNRVNVRYSTHAIAGLSENDFICAAKIEKLMQVEAAVCEVK